MKQTSKLQNNWALVGGINRLHRQFPLTKGQWCESVSMSVSMIEYGPLARYVKLRVAHAPGMPGTFSPPPRFSDPDMHHGTCVTHVPWWMPGSLTSDLLESWWWGKRSRHSRRMRKPHIYVSGKRPIETLSIVRTRHLPIDRMICQKQKTIKELAVDMKTLGVLLV